MAGADTTQLFVSITYEGIRLAQPHDGFCHTIRARLVDVDRVLFALDDDEISFRSSDGHGLVLISQSFVLFVLH